MPVKMIGVDIAKGNSMTFATWVLADGTIHQIRLFDRCMPEHLYRLRIESIKNKFKIK